MADNDGKNVHLFRPRTKPSRFESWWSSLETATKAGFLLLTFTGAVAATVKGCDRAVSGPIAAVAAAQGKVDGEQDAAIEVIDEDVDLLFQTQVKLTTDVDWLKQEVSGIRKDLRDMDRGRPLAPLPTPHPTAVDTPTPAPGRPVP